MLLPRYPFLWVVRLASCTNKVAETKHDEAWWGVLVGCDGAAQCASSQLQGSSFLTNLPWNCFISRCFLIALQVRWWDVTEGKAVSRLKGHTDYVRAAAVSPLDSNTWATGGRLSPLCPYGRHFCRQFLPDARCFSFSAFGSRTHQAVPQAEPRVH